MINAVNTDVPGYAGIIIIAICTFLVTLFGYKIVHVYEFWSWVPATIIFLIILGTFAHSGDFVAIPWAVGTSEMGSVLSYGSIIFGFATGWSSYAADYTVYQPSSQKRWKVFLFTFIGLIIPLYFTQMLGVAVMSATAINGGDNIYQAGYDAASTGGILGAVLIDRYGTFGKFCMVILALTIIANNCPNIYSVSLTVQVLARWTQSIPRFLWTAVATGAYIAIAIPGYSHFELVLENFMNFIGYWLAIYSSISLTDHFVFKRGLQGYAPELYDQPSKLPPGFAAVFAFCCGVAGMVTGMSQQWVSHHSIKALLFAVRESVLMMLQYSTSAPSPCTPACLLSAETSAGNSRPLLRAWDTLSQDPLSAGSLVDRQASVERHYHTHGWRRIRYCRKTGPRPPALYGFVVQDGGLLRRCLTCGIFFDDRDEFTYCLMISRH